MAESPTYQSGLPYESLKAGGHFVTKQSFNNDNDIIIGKKVKRRRGLPEEVRGYGPSRVPVPLQGSEADGRRQAGGAQRCLELSGGSERRARAARRAAEAGGPSRDALARDLARARRRRAFASG